MKNLMIVLVIGIFLAACSPSAPAAPTVDIEAVKTTIAQTIVAGQHQTATASAPTSTPLPTETPLPTDTPVPTETPTPAPQPITLTGNGSQVVDLKKWDGVALARASYQGGDNFIVYNFDAANTELGLVFNGLYNYHGTKLIDAEDSELTTRLQVNTTGAWTIDVLPMSSAPVLKLPGTYEGEDDGVILINSTPDLLKYKAMGDSNFIIYAWDQASGRRKLTVNEIGPIEGSAILPASTIILEVSGRGKWSIEITVK